MSPGAWVLRTYTDADEAAAIELWRRSWQSAYPAIDFSARLDWWRTRWRNELVPRAQIVVAEDGGALVGLVTIDPATGYLDQIVVAPEAWGQGVAEALLAAAADVSPAGIDLLVNQDNTRALHFYAKHGFAVTGTEVNPRSGAPVYRMSRRSQP